MSYLVKAIRQLKPNSEFSFVDEDYSTIEWFSLDGDAPTQSEIDDAIELIKSNEIAANDLLIAKKQSAMDKLTALGLTADEVAALLP
jgi:hypothetical protein